MSDVWVIAEQRLGKLMNVSLELLGKGAELCQILNVKLGAVLLGDKVEALANELICYGADKVYLADDPRLRLYQSEIFTDVVTNLINAHKPQIVLVGATRIGQNLAPSIAAKLKTGLTAHCMELHIIDEDNGKPLLVQVVPGWQGNLMVKITCPVKRPQIATVSPGVMAKSDRVERKGEIFTSALDIHEAQRTEALEIALEESSEADIEEAEVVVAGGWGLFSAGGFELVEELAKALNGTVAGTRPALDSGWISEQRMVGQSGKTVKPKLFISVGASGATQFTAGFQKAKVVLAIDQNPNAPIFNVADVGIVGDLREIIPCLIAELKETDLCV